MKPTAKIETVTQDQFVEILCLEEEIRMIRAEIRRKKRAIADAMVSGAVVESGCHQVKLDQRAGIKVLPWRGAILRYTSEEWDSSEKEASTPMRQSEPEPAKSFLILAPRSPIEDEQTPVA